MRCAARQGKASCRESPVLRMTSLPPETCVFLSTAGEKSSKKCLRLPKAVISPISRALCMIICLSAWLWRRMYVSPSSCPGLRWHLSVSIRPFLTVRCRGFDNVSNNYLVLAPSVHCGRMRTFMPTCLEASPDPPAPVSLLQPRLAAPSLASD